MNHGWFLLFISHSCNFPRQLKIKAAEHFHKRKVQRSIRCSLFLLAKNTIFTMSNKIDPSYIFFSSVRPITLICITSLHQLQPLHAYWLDFTGLSSLHKCKCNCNCKSHKHVYPPLRKILWLVSRQQGFTEAFPQQCCVQFNRLLWPCSAKTCCPNRNKVLCLLQLL